MQLAIEDFAAFHEAVHEAQPFPWQTRLLREVVEGRAWPRVLDLPTGAGKTTCIDIALFALALDLQKPAARWCPTRIAMVVDRRIVVDQVAERGRKLLAALRNDGGTPVICRVAELLRSSSKDAEDPVGVFTLRGGMPKDDSWARTPDQPLILASTVDQLGSRLLMQGYGVSQGMKPVHAGLLANDLLLLLDEVHLSQPFSETLEALAHLRKRFAKAGLPARFHHAFLSATPGAAAHAAFRLSDAERSKESPLGRRLNAPKATRLFEEPNRQALELACIEHAGALIKAHDVVAVVVNRVGSASTISRQLREKHGQSVDVVLLTGRMRPLDRDDVVARLRPRIMTGRARDAEIRKLIVVGTQCIEAGADFDFDALVTEAASLDALRQRFGRVDRLGNYGKAAGVIIRDKSSKTDPVYGDAIVETFAWLKERLGPKTKDIDFGVLALPAPSADESPSLLAPKPSAPALLPAYLDLWVQSAPAPVVVPDITLWLHGPAAGPADVQVLWRADLRERDLASAEAGGDADRERLIEIVAAVRPGSLEAMSLPFGAARRWLRGSGGAEVSDVEGAPIEEAEAGGGSRPGLALRWSGDDSEVISWDGLRPGDTIVLPSERGGLRDGCFDPSASEPIADLAERAMFQGRGRSVLRLHPKVLAQLRLSVDPDELAEARATLARLAEEEATPWRKIWLEQISKSRSSIVVDADTPFVVLAGARLSARRLALLLQADESTAIEDGIELTTDDDDSFHAGRSVSLSEHSRDVESFARAYARGVALPSAVVDDLALAGWLHDIGKADRRFQILLRGGSEIDYFKDESPWAKSAMPPGARASHRLAQRRSGYPAGTRHEVQSIAMIERHVEQVRERAHDLDLVLHLVASHHGHCRPFAPVSTDDAPVEVALRGHSSTSFGTIDFAATSSKHDLHRLDSPLADRFWKLVERYGWMELCWLEAILRLADHRASESEQREGVGA